MLNKAIRKIWLFLFNILSLDTSSLREDARKIGLALTSAGAIGFVVKLDKVTYTESVLLFSVGLIVWILALLKPHDTDDSREEKSDKK